MAVMLKTEDMEIGARKVRLALPETTPETIIYLHGDDEEGVAALAAAGAGAAVAVITGVDWDADLSPWAAPRAFARGEDFAGNARNYRKELTGKIVPAVEAKLPAPVRTRAIAGYSLAGLFALYAA